jgi:hypothetical protein
VEWLRCAFRLGGSPGYWFNYLGFRVVVVPHFSTTSGL